VTVTRRDLDDAHDELGVSESSTTEAIAESVAMRVSESVPKLVAAIAEKREQHVVEFAQLLNAADVIGDHRGSTPPPDKQAASHNHGGAVESERAADTILRDSIGGADEVLWPALPKAEEARSLLQAWAAAKRFVDANAFDADLELSDATICRSTVVRLVETRREEYTTVPGDRVPVSGSYRGSISLVEVPPPTGFQAERWELAMDGSVSTYRCPSGCVDGQQRCTWCGGRGVNPCPPTKSCPRCSGSGTQSNYSGQGQPTKGPCSNCAGRGQVPCSSCGGAGQKTCLPCMGQGSSTCKTCGGTSAVTEFQKGVIDRRPVEATIETDPPADVKVPKHGIWKKYGPFPGTAPPAGLPAAVQTQLAAEVTKRPDGELLRKVDVEVFPIVAIAYQRDDEMKAAYLLGQERNVQARGIRKVRLDRRVLVGLSVLIVLLALALGLWFGLH
jgi:hypothetical protein